MPNAVAENVLGTIGTICWSAQMFPQVYKSWREKSTEGLSHWLVLIWGMAAAFVGVYVILQNLNIPLILQPELFGTLCAISWGQCQYYGARRSRITSILMALGLMAGIAAFQLAMVFALRTADPESQNYKRGLQFFGVFSSVMISAGLVPQYYEIWKYQEVIGISLIFMSVDALGGVFSDLSLAFKEKFDVLAAVIYTLVIVLDGAVLLAALILNPRARRKRRQQALASEAGSSPDTPSMAAVESGGASLTHASASYSVS